MQSRDDEDIGCFRWRIRTRNGEGALRPPLRHSLLPPPPFARFAFYSQRPIVACSMKQMHIERVLFRRRVPTTCVDTLAAVTTVYVHENLSLCEWQWVSARHSSRVFTYQSEEHSHPPRVEFGQTIPGTIRGLENGSNDSNSGFREEVFKLFSRNFYSRIDRRLSIIHQPTITSSVTSSRRICQRWEAISSGGNRGAHRSPIFPRQRKGCSVAINTPRFSFTLPPLKVTSLSSNNPNLQIWRGKRERDSRWSDLIRKIFEFGKGERFESFSDYSLLELFQNLGFSYVSFFFCKFYGTRGGIE